MQKAAPMEDPDPTAVTVYKRKQLTNSCHLNIVFLPGGSAKVESSKGNISCFVQQIYFWTLKHGHH